VRFVFTEDFLIVHKSPQIQLITITELILIEIVLRSVDGVNQIIITGYKFTHMPVA
jgi:hypothetical protein